MEEKQEEEFIEFDELVDANFKEEEKSEPAPIKKKARKQEVVIEEAYPVTKKVKYVKDEPARRQHAPVKVERNYSLAVYDIKDEFLRRLEERQVVVVTGETGCGKSTQIPQMILESSTEARTKIICTQPRRIAAISLAQRVATEVGCALGNKVGYIVGMDSVTSSETKIEFVTTGIMLQKLVFEREKFFEDYTHIIMDEVHERDLDIDFAFIIIKHFLKDHKNVKLILMSATICCEKFSNYFSDYSVENIFNEQVIQNTIKEFMLEERMKVEESKWGQHEEDQSTGWVTPQVNKMERWMIEQQKQENELKRINREKGLHFLGPDGIAAPIVEIPDKRIFSISCYYLDTLQEYFGEFDIRTPELAISRSMFNFERPTIIDTQKQGFFLILELLNRIRRNDRNTSSVSQGSILVFLPGYQEIMDIKEQLDESLYQIIVLHGSISTSSKELNNCWGKRRRVILSTNIAESSITVPDCQYVVDFCLSKAIQYNSKTLTERLVMEFSSQSSCLQRMGRVGRVGEGICFRLVPRDLYESKFRVYADCEMVRCPLEKILLRIAKTHLLEVEQTQQLKQQQEKEGSGEVSLLRQRQHIFKDWQKVLSTALDPPSLSQIGYSVRNLQKVGALKINETQFDSSHHAITKLGLLMCDLPIDIYLSRFIVIAALLKCPHEGITVAAILSQRKNFFEAAFRRNQISYLNTIYHFDKGDQDEVLMQLRVYDRWEKTFFRPFEHAWPDKSNYRKMLKRFTSRGVARDEVQFAQDTCVDLKTMREVLLVKYEIFMRMQSDLLDDPREHNLDDPDFVMLLKTALVGGFYAKCVLVTRQTTKEVERRVNMLKVNSLNQENCLILESAEELDSEKVKALIQNYSHQKVKTIVKQKNTMAVEFHHKHNLIFRRLLHELDMLSRKHLQRYQSNYLTASSQLTQYLITTGTLAYHCHQAKLYGVGKEVMCDGDSINFVQIAEEEPYYLVCYDITEKDGSKRNIARHSSRVDRWPNWVAISIMLFGCNVMLEQEHNRFTKLLENQGTEIPLRNFFKEDEILEINDIRERIKTNLLEHDFSYDFWHEIKQLNRPREKMVLFSQDKWQPLFEKECKDKLNLLRVPQPQAKKKIRGLHNHGQFTGIHIDEFKTRFIGESGGFMEPISTYKANENNDAQLTYFDDYGIAQYSQTLKLYRDWKQNLLVHLAKQERQTYMNNSSILVCSQCQDYVQIGTSENLQYFYDGKPDANAIEWLKGAAQVMKINQFTDHFHFCMRPDLIEEFLKDDLVKAIFVKLNLEPKEFVFFTCPQQNHVFGLFLKSHISDIYTVNRILVITQKLRVVHLNLEEYVYNMRKYSIEELVKKDKELYSKLVPQLEEQWYECKLCVNEVTYEEHFREKGKRAYRKHLISQGHQKNLEEFKLSMK